MKSIISKTNRAAALPVVLFISTGGTIAMKRDQASNAPIPSISGEELLSSVSGISDIASIEVINHLNVPSVYLGPLDWVILTRLVKRSLLRADVVGVVISHGTDTLEESAFWLDLTLKSDKPIVLFGAQRNASEKDSDGPRNLLDAVRIAIDPGSQGTGVLVAMNSQISTARDVVKTHTMDVTSFKCGEIGFLGVVDPDRIVYSRQPSKRQHIPLSGNPIPKVEITTAYGGSDGRAIEDMVKRGVDGIVVQALGLGNVNIPMFIAIKSAVASGVQVVISSRVQHGRVLPIYGFEGGGKTLKDEGAIFSDLLNPAKARILLILLLQNGITSQSQLQTAFSF